MSRGVPRVVLEAPRAGAAERPSRTPVEAGGGVSPLVLGALPLVALTELILVRTFYRVGIFIPREGLFRAVYAGLTALGSFAFNLSTVLAYLALGLLARRAWRFGRRRAALALGAFGAAALLVSLPGVGEAGPALRLLLLLAVAVVLAPFLRAPDGGLGKAAVAAAGLAVLLSSYAGLVGDAARLVPRASGTSGTVAAQLAGEAVVVVAGLLFFLAWLRERGPALGPLVAGALAGGALLVAWQANGAVTGILVLWTAGLRLYLPVALYGAALGGVAAAAVGWLGGRPWRSAGLTLLLVGGFLLDTSYAQVLAVLAFLFLTEGVAVGGLPGRRPAAPATARR